MTRVVWMPGGVRTEIHLTAEETAGELFLMTDAPPPGWALPPHRHLNESETIHFLEGEFEMTVDGRTARFGPGETVHIPRGVVHSGGNAGEAPGRRVVLFTPAGIEGFFLETGTAAPDEAADLAAAVESAARHGWEFIAPRS